MNKKKLIIFIIIALGLSLLMVGAFFLDERTNHVSIYSIILKTLFIIGCTLFLIIKKKHVFKDNRKYLKRICLEIIILFLINLLMSIRIINRGFEVYTLIVTILSIFTTAVWEELFYRCIGSTIVLDDSYNPKGVMILSGVFALSHLVNLVSGDYLSTILIVIFAFGFSVYLYSSYLLTNSIAGGIVLHFIINFSNSFFALLSTKGNMIDIFVIPMYIILSIICIYLAYGHRKKLLSKLSK